MGSKLSVDEVSSISIVLQSRHGRYFLSSWQQMPAYQQLLAVAPMRSGHFACKSRPEFAQSS
jgi:hypothetical protein